MITNLYQRLQLAEHDLMLERAKNAKLEATVEYLSMMTDVEIPEDGDEYEQEI